MERLTENKIILLTRQTRLDELVHRFNTIEQARFYVEHLGADFSDYQQEDKRYQASVVSAMATLGTLGRVQVLSRAFLPNFLFGPEDIVVVLGQDGLVANTLKYLENQPVIGVNPDPERWDGVLLPFLVGDLGNVVREVLQGKRAMQDVTMAMAELNDGQKLYGVNDLFIGPRSHISARYEINVDGKRENHSSSGIIVSTGLGSTGWFKSLIAGALGIAGEITGEELGNIQPAPTPWNASWLYFTVREPFPSKHSEATILFGTVSQDHPLLLTSHMPEHGVIFSDGIESDYLHFNSGTTARIVPADKVGKLVV
ncbi:MAG: sugar kinase [Candidatus Kapaibacterium sp.]